MAAPLRWSPITSRLTAVAALSMVVRSKACDLLFNVSQRRRGGPSRNRARHSYRADSVHILSGELSGNRPPCSRRAQL
jgi:hypothetical protein